MPLLNFQSRFCPLIESGQKRQTIRADRKYPIHKGDKLYLWSGLRTKNYKRIITPENVKGADGIIESYVICKSVDTINITSSCLYHYQKLRFHDIYGGDIIVNYKTLSPEEVLQLIRDDGFDSRDRQEIGYADYDDKSDFFGYFYKNYGTIFQGILIKW